MIRVAEANERNLDGASLDPSTIAHGRGVRWGTCLVRHNQQDVGTFYVTPSLRRNEFYDVGHSIANIGFESPRIAT